MQNSDSRLIVVRAWCDADRLIIRLIVGGGPAGPAAEWVFVDIAAAGARLAAILGELHPGPDSPGSSTRVTPAERRPDAAPPAGEPGAEPETKR